MPAARYAPLPNPYNDPDTDREMNDAFQLEDHDDDDDDDHSENTPLTRHTAHAPDRTQLSVATQPEAYDFERDYDYDFPPPGSPPDPSFARPNDFGNSNGVLPSAPVRPQTSRPSMFRRVVGALLPQHYQRVPTEPGAQRRVGGGLQNDGVFANVMAKPVTTRHVEVHGDNGDVYMVPEETQAQAPPSYHEAQADAVPPYWETTVHAPGSLDPNADMVVDDLPTGSWLLFFANVFISWFFQFIGFLFAYLLHTTHAAKYGARVGLGMTLIQFGFYSRRQMMEDIIETSPNGSSWNETIGMMPGMEDGMNGAGPSAGNGTVLEPDAGLRELGSHDWMAFLLMTLGWFLLLSSLAGFFRVKRWENSIRRASPPVVERDSESRPAMEQSHIFPLFLGMEREQHSTERQGSATAMSEADIRLTRDLRAAGLI